MFNVIIRYIFIFLLVTQYLWFDLIWSDFDVGIVEVLLRIIILLPKLNMMKARIMYRMFV